MTMPNYTRISASQSCIFSKYSLKLMHSHEATQEPDSVNKELCWCISFYGHKVIYYSRIELCVVKPVDQVCIAIKTTQFVSQLNQKNHVCMMLLTY